MNKENFGNLSATTTIVLCVLILTFGIIGYMLFDWIEEYIIYIAIGELILGLLITMIGYEIIKRKEIRKR